MQFDGCKLPLTSYTCKYQTLQPILQHLHSWLTQKKKGVSRACFQNSLSLPRAKRPSSRQRFYTTLNADGSRLKQALPSWISLTEQNGSPSPTADASRSGFSIIFPLSGLLFSRWSLCGVIALILVGSLEFFCQLLAGLSQNNQTRPHMADGSNSSR